MATNARSFKNMLLLVRMLSFDIDPRVYFCFCCLCLWRQTQKFIAKTHVQQLTASVFSEVFQALCSSH